MVWGRSQLQSPNGDSNSTNRLIFPTIFSTYTFNIPSSIYFNNFLFTNNYQVTQSHKVAFELIGLPVFEQFQSFYPCQPCYLLNLKRLLKFRAKLSFQVCPKGVDCNAYDILGLYDVQNTNAIISWIQWCANTFSDHRIIRSNSMNNIWLNISTPLSHQSRIDNIVKNQESSPSGWRK